MNFTPLLIFSITLGSSSIRMQNLGTKEIALLARLILSSIKLVRRLIIFFSLRKEIEKILRDSSKKMKKSLLMKVFFEMSTSFSMYLRISSDCVLLENLKVLARSFMASVLICKFSLLRYFNVNLNKVLFTKSSLKNSFSQLI